MKNFKKFMAETKEMNRWFISLVFMVGLFAGAVLATVWSFFRSNTIKQ